MLLEAHELVVVENMHQRKHLMFMKSDAFVALPGGLGTLEEFVEQLTWSQLEQHQKPIVLANIDGFWDPLLTLFGGCRARASSAMGSSFTSRWSTGRRDHSRHHARARAARRTRKPRRRSASSERRLILRDALAAPQDSPQRGGRPRLEHEA